MESDQTSKASSHSSAEGQLLVLVLDVNSEQVRLFLNCANTVLKLAEVDNTNSLHFPKHNLVVQTLTCSANFYT